MAVRPQHMHDGGIVERRLRPIYDWLDNGNNKKALQEAEKVLKKSPSLQAARALKALALFRLGKKSQAHALLDELAAEKLSDDTTLQAMTISYRESQQLHKVCELYESAVKVEPLNEELHSHLFMSYVRVGDYRSQQRAAMALYKFAPKNPYYFWAVMSIVLQAKTSEDATKKGILLSLAQRMVDNFITENKMEAEQEARLYIMILELQEKWEDILKFIESPLYSQLVPGSSAQACIPYLKKLGQWRRLNLLCKDLLWDNQDRWDYYLPYFDSVFQLIKEGGESGESNADDTAEKCHEFICQLVESMSSGRTLRGPYLARLELWKRLSEDGDPTSLLGSGMALCVQYLRVFANKPCAVPDLRPYLAMLPVKERQEQSRDFLTCLGFDEKTEPETTEDIQRHISCLSLWRVAAPPLAAAECLALANTLRAHYLRSLTKGLLTATLTEFCATDGYGILAAHHYFYAGHSCLSLWRVAAPPLAAAECLALANTLRAHYLRSLTKGLLTATLTEFCATDGYGILAAHHYFYAGHSCLSLWRVAAPPPPAAECLALANTLRAHYLRSLTKGLLTATLTEFCATDGYGILAAHHYFYAAMQQKSTAPVVEALCLLELVLSHSPANFHVKLLLVHLYHFLGNAIAADSIYQRLEVKHIQLVSLGWLHAARLAPACAPGRALQLLANTVSFYTHHAKDLVSLGWLHAARLAPACAPGRALQLLANTVSFYTHHAKDSVEHLTYAYKYGTFEKLVELRAWGERLEACSWGGLAARDKALLALLAGPAALLHAPARRLPPLPTDNRDLNVIVSFEPPENHDPNLKQRTFDQETSYLRLKDALLSSIALCIECSDNRPLEERKPQYEELKTCIDAFSEAMLKCKEKYSEREKISISVPYPSRIFAFVNSPVPYRELYSETLRMVGDLAMSNARDAHARCEAVTKLVANAPDQLRKHVATDDWSLRDTLETLSNYLEFIGIIKCLLGVCNELIAPANTKKSKKKTNQSPDEIKTTELLNKLNETIQNSITFLEETFTKLPQHRYESTLEKEFSKLTIDKHFGICPVEAKLQSGRQDMITEVQYLLTSKTQFLKSYIH